MSRIFAKDSMTRRGETLASVLIGVFILTIVIAGLSSVLFTNKSFESDYERNNALFYLRNNASNVVRKVDTSGIQERETFYLKKDPVARTYTVLTGSSNSALSYVNARSEQVTNTGTYEGQVFLQMFYMDKRETVAGGSQSNQIIRAGIKELVRK